MPRTLLTFSLSDASKLPDLLREFALHDGVDARPTGIDAQLAVEIEDSTAAIWNVRATVGLFDEGAIERLNEGAPGNSTQLQTARVENDGSANPGA